MVDVIQRRKILLKRAAVSSVIISVILIAILGLFARFYYVGPRCTTNYFHFNIDYRLGNEEVEDRIIQEPYYKMLQMYERHPNWAFTIECQAEMMYRIYNEEEYEDIAELTTKLVERGQMELMCAIQFSQLFYAYPADVLELNLKYANETLDDCGLLDERSNCILFQEGQYGYGLGTSLNSPYAGNIDTSLISSQQIRDFQKSGYLGGDSPVFKLKNPETGKSIKLLQYDYLPKWEAGYMHSWNFLLDAELGFEDPNAEEEFTVSEERLRMWEQQHYMLEQEGNEFMTCSQWVKHCEEVDAVKTLDYYIPECNWGTTKYNSSYIWAANNGDSTDDGEMLANNYRARQYITATRHIYEDSAVQAALSNDNKTAIDSKLTRAEKYWLQATCTDATGIGPDSYERYTAEQNVNQSAILCSEILEIIGHEYPEFNSTQLQVDLNTGAIFNNTSNFNTLITMLDDSLELKDLPLEVDLSSVVSEGDDVDPTYTVSLVNYNSCDNGADSKSYNLTRFDVTFAGTYDWADDRIQKISIKFSFEEGSGKSFSEIVYCPSLLEEYTKRLWRYDYIYEPLYIFLPLSNGLMFIPDDYTGYRGTAIIKNVTQRHTSWLWDYYSTEVLETEGLHMDAHHQFYIMDDVKLEDAVDFANRINVSPPWMVSKNVSLIQGYEVYDMYKTIDNRLTDGQEGSGEWW